MWTHDLRDFHVHRVVAVATTADREEGRFEQNPDLLRQSAFSAAANDAHFVLRARQLLAGSSLCAWLLHWNGLDHRLVHCEWHVGQAAQKDPPASAVSPTGPRHSVNE